MWCEDRHVMHLSCDAHDWKNLTESSLQINVIFGCNICKILLVFNRIYSKEE